MEIAEEARERKGFMFEGDFRGAFMVKEVVMYMHGGPHGGPS